MTRRVLMTADAVGGVWTYALELADALAPLGIETHLATMGPALSDDQRVAVEASAVASVHESHFALEWMDRPWRDVDRAGEWLLALEEETRPDIVHLNGYAHAVLPWRAPCISVAHSDVVSWWNAVRREPAPASWDEYRRRVREGVTAASLVVAPTLAVADDIERHYGRRPQVVANGRRASWLEPGVAKEPLVLGIGRVWDAAKNLGALDGVAGALPWPVAIAGDGHPAAASRFLGRLPFSEVARWLARASIFVLPARYEPFGLAALEAAQAGCALVLGDIASLREVWEDAALYVSPDDPAALAAAITRLADDHGLRAELADAARHRAAIYTPERMAAAYAALYETAPIATAGGASR